jgi:hypothetical protein
VGVLTVVVFGDHHRPALAQAPVTVSLQKPPDWWRDVQMVCDGRGNLVLRGGSGASDTWGGVVKDEQGCNNVAAGEPPR